MIRCYAARCAGIMAAVALAGCVSRPAPAPSPAPAPRPAGPSVPAACELAPAGSPLVGAWYGSSQQSGVRGELQTLMTVAQDGSFTLQRRVKAGRAIRSELRESGCWQYADGTYSTRITRSNGDVVDGSDPIYRNAYRVEKVDAARLVYRENKPGAKSTTLKKMRPGYRLP